MILKLALFLGLAFAFAGTVSAVPDKVVCYLGTWATYRPGNGKFDIENIDGSLCTHVIYAFVGIGANGDVRILDSGLDLSNGGLKRFNNLKQKYPGLKTLVAVGGWNEGSTRFSAVAADANLRKTFINNAINFVKTHGFDGFDLDWEYPGDRDGSRPDDKKNFATLVSEMRTAFNQQSPRLLLTAAVKATEQGIQLSYDVPTLSKNLDWINIMAYDLHTHWDGMSGQNAPLYASPTDNNKQLNVDACVKAWLRAGAASEKLVLGMGTYGQTYTLQNPSNAGPNAPISGGGAPGPYTQQGGILGYNEICEMQKQGGWTEKFDNDQQVPIAIKGNTWIGYDNPKSITIKTEYVKKNNLGGAMIWSLETEDFRGICGKNYPLLRAINDALKRPVESTSSSSTSSTSTTSTTAKPPAPGQNCSKQGFIPHPTDCSKFIYCMANGSGFTEIVYNCQPGLEYDAVAQACNWPQLANCKH